MSVAPVHHITNTLRRPGIWTLMLCFLLAPVLAVPASAQQATPSSLWDNPAIAFAPDTVPTKFGDVTIPDHPERIITLTDGALDAMIALGIVPVGITTSANFQGPATYLADKVPASVAYVGGWGELDLEQVVALNPDLILSNRYLTGDDYEILTKIAPVVAPDEIDVAGPDTLQQWEYEQLVWGHAVRQDAASRALIEGVRSRAGEIGSRLDPHAGESVVVFRPEATFPVVMSQRWITGTVLTWSGFTGNAFSNDLNPPHSGSRVSLEQLDLLEADWLLVAIRDDAQTQAIAAYEDSPLFQTLSAPGNNQMVLVSGDLWSGATGVLAAHAMLDDIERIFIDGETG